MGGELRGAIADSRWALDVSERRWSRARAAAQATLASALIAMGDVAGARAEVATWNGALAWNGSPLRVLILVALGDLDLVEAKPDVALARFADAAELAEEVGVRNPLVVPHSIRRAMTLLQLGDRARARALAEESAAEAHELGLGLAEARSMQVAARMMDRPQAFESLEIAIELFCAAGARLDLAGAHLALGSGLVTSDRRGAGIAHLRTAEELGLGCGAEPLVQRVRAQLRRAGARSRRPRTSLDVLTPGEQRAADLVHRGLTNRQIAEELFVSVKAVEWHLSNVYRKLGVQGRRELRDSFTSAVDSPRSTANPAALRLRP